MNFMAPGEEPVFNKMMSLSALRVAGGGGVEGGSPVWERPPELSMLLHLVNSALAKTCRSKPNVQDQSHKLPVDTACTL